MKIAELFIDLGVKGKDEASGALSKVNSGLNGIVSSGLAGKAAILGVLYGAQSLASSAGAAGQQMMNFAAETDLSIEMLSKWHAQGRKFGTTEQTITQSVMNIQNAMAKMKNNLGAPQGFDRFAQMTNLDINKAFDEKNGPWYVLSKLQEYYRKEDPSKLRLFAEGLGANGMLGMLRRLGTTDVASTPAQLTESQMRAAAAVDARMENFQYRLKRAGQNVALKVAPGAIGELEHAMSGMNKFVKVLGDLDKAAPALKYIAGALAAIAGISFAPVTAGVVGLTAVLADVDKGKKGYLSRLYEWNKEVDQNFGKWISRYILRAQPGSPNLAEQERRRREGYVSPNLLDIYKTGGDYPKGDVTINVNNTINGDVTSKTLNDLNSTIKNTIPPLLKGQKK